MLSLTPLPVVADNFLSEDGFSITEALGPEDTRGDVRAIGTQAHAGNLAASIQGLQTEKASLEWKWRDLEQTYQNAEMDAEFERQRAAEAEEDYIRATNNEHLLALDVNVQKQTEAIRKTSDKLKSLTEKRGAISAIIFGDDEAAATDEIFDEGDRLDEALRKTNTALDEIKRDKEEAEKAYAAAAKEAGIPVLSIAALRKEAVRAQEFSDETSKQLTRIERQGKLLKKEYKQVKTKLQEAVAVMAARSPEHVTPDTVTDETVPTSDAMAPSNKEDLHEGIDAGLLHDIPSQDGPQEHVDEKPRSTSVTHAAMRSAPLRRAPGHEPGPPSATNAPATEKSEAPTQPTDNPEVIITPRISAPAIRKPAASAVVVPDSKPKASSPSPTVSTSVNGTSKSAAVPTPAGVQTTAPATVKTTVVKTTVVNAPTITTISAEPKEVLDTTNTSASFMSNAAAVSSSRAVARATTARLETLRANRISGASLDGETGVASGDEAYEAYRKGMWARASGSWARQDSQNGIAGYDHYTQSHILGMDNLIEDDVRVGLALSTSKSKMRGDGDDATKTDVHSYQVTGYASYEPGAYFVEGQMAYAYNIIDTARTTISGAYATGKTHAHQYNVTLRAGMPFSFEGGPTITPNVGLFYSKTHMASYLEKNAGRWNLEVDSDRTHVLEASLGASLAQEHISANGSILRPELRAAVLYEFLGDDAATTAKYTDTGATFKTLGIRHAKVGGTVGAGVGYTTEDGRWEVRADYDVEIRQDFVSHNGMLTGRFNF